MSLLLTIREAASKNCDVVFYPEWNALGIEVRLRDSGGTVVKAAGNQASDKELVAAVCPEAVVEHRLKTAMEMVLSDEPVVW